MSTTWETLVAGSTIEAGSAWDHLTHQGGSGGKPTVILASAIDAVLTAGIMAGDVLAEAMGADLAAGILAATVTAATLGADIETRTDAWLT